VSSSYGTGGGGGGLRNRSGPPAESPADPQAGRFLEHANVHGNIYGTSFDAIRAVSDAVRALLVSPRECLPPQVLGVSQENGNPQVLGVSI
jgi:hypothetical protein